MMSNEPNAIGPQEPQVGQGTVSPRYLYIPVSRLIWMPVLSYGLYQAYWVYRNWRYIAERDGLRITPFWRGVFAIFFTHDLLRRMHDDPAMQAVEQPRFNPSSLATGFVLLWILSLVIERLGIPIPGPFVPSYLCLASVQSYVNSVTERASPGARFHGWSAGHIVCIVLGCLCWLVLLAGFVLCVLALLSRAYCD